MNIDEICFKANKFYKLATNNGIEKKASILSDMANRTMFGAIGAFNNDIINDITIINNVAKGAEDILIFGIMTCANEIKTSKPQTIYKKHFPDQNILKNITLYKFNYQEIPQYELLLDTYLDAFNDPEWTYLHGGPIWARIVVSLQKILSNYKEFIVAKSSKEKIKYGNAVIYSLSLFDNLAHNTGSIFDKFSFIEWDKYTEGKSSQEKSDMKYNPFITIRSAKNLLNSKNLKNPYDALVEAEKNLDILLPFSEKYLSKIRSTKEYAEAKGRNKEQELKNISMKKRKISIIEHFIYNLKSIISKSDYLKSKFDSATTQHIINSDTNKLFLESNILLDQILEFKNNLSMLNINYPISKDIALFSKNYTSLARLNSLRILIRKEYEKFGLNSSYNQFDDFIKRNLLFKNKDVFEKEYWELADLVNHTSLISIKNEAENLLDKINLVLQEIQI